VTRRFVAALLVLAGFAAAALGAQPRTPLESIQANAVKLSSLDLNADLADLEGFGALVGDARVVGLGEGTHGTAEFTRVRARMTEYLIQRKGFTTVALETSWAGARDLNAYVQGGEGDPRVLLARYARLSWPWRTEEMLELLAWLRAHNASSAVKVRFTGFDLQDPVSAADWVSGFLEANAPELVERVDDLVACVRFSIGNVLATARFASRGEAGAQACRERVSRAYTLLETRRAALEARAGTLEYRQALHAAEVLNQEAAYLDARLVNFWTDANELRDRFMARNIQWLEATFGGKVVAWAHNGHVTFTPDMAFGWKPFGAYLRERFGVRYVAVATTYGAGSFNAQLIGTDLVRTLSAAALGLTVNPSEQRIPDPVKDSFEDLFLRSGMPLFMLPLRVPKTGDSAWLWQKRVFRMVPQALPIAQTPDEDWYSYKATLPNEFDAVVFVRDSTPIRLL
jgi:erythromycin esterase